MRLLAWVGFAALCGLAASEWLVPGERVNGAGSLLLQASAYALVAGVSLPAAWWARRRGASDGGQTESGEETGGGRGWRLAIAGGGALGVPVVLFGVAAWLGAGGFVAAALCTAPLWAMVTVAARRGEALERSLTPALAGLGGALLLLPVAEPGSGRAGWGAGLCLAAAAVLGVSLTACGQAMRRRRVAESVLIVSTAVAAVLAAAGGLLGGGRAALPTAPWSGWWPQLLVQVAAAGLGVMLLRELPARVYATQFLWVPLVAAVEGYVMLRPGLTLRTVLGAGLLAAGAGVLTWGGEGLRDEVLSLR